MAKSNQSQPIVIDLHSHQYPIYIGGTFSSYRALLQACIVGKQVMVVTNETIAPLYLETLRNILEPIQCDCVVLKDGEAFKNQDSLNQIYDALIEKQHHRDTTLIALGGGVVGDITGFAASTYQRGVDYIQIPTTLLAQVDSSVGGKTAINHPRAKNMIGHFYHPKAVFMDLTTLNTLPPRELCAGFAEVIKYGVLMGGPVLENIHIILSQSWPDFKNPVWGELIRLCCISKATIVQADEKEQGMRALLNLGHTFAHALEAYTSYQRWRHGEAVAIGLYCAALLSYKMGYLSKIDLNQIDEWLVSAKLPRRIPRGIDLNQLQRLLFQDKKVKNKRLRFVLIKQIGDCFIDDTVSESCIKETLSQAVEGENEHESWKQPISSPK